MTPLRSPDGHKRSLMRDWDSLIPQLPPQTLRLIGSALVERNGYSLVVISLPEGVELTQRELTALHRLCKTAVVTVLLLWTAGPTLPTAMLQIGYGGVSDMEAFNRKKLCGWAKRWWKRADSSGRAVAREAGTAEVITSTGLIEGVEPDRPLSSDLGESDTRLDYTVFEGCFAGGVLPSDIDLLVVSATGRALIVEHKRAGATPRQDEGLSGGQLRAFRELASVGVIEALVVWFDGDRPVRMCSFRKDGGFSKRDCDLDSFRQQVAEWAGGHATMVPGYSVRVVYEPASMLNTVFSKKLQVDEKGGLSEAGFVGFYRKCCDASGVEPEPDDAVLPRLRDRLRALGAIQLGGGTWCGVRLVSG